MRDEPGTLGGFPPATFESRRAEVFSQLDAGAMVLASAPLRFKSKDTSYRYRADSDLFYLTGHTGPDCVAVLRPFAEEERFVVFVPPRDPVGERWTGTRLEPQAVGELFGADAAHPLSELDERLPKLLSSAESLHYRSGSSDRIDRLAAQVLRSARERRPARGVGPRSLIDPSVVLGELRLRKDDVEIQAIRNACAVTVAGFSEALAAVRPGMGEWEVEATLESYFRKNGAFGPAFPTIVGSGENGCVLHYERNEARLEEGGLVLVDGGAEVTMYCGDVSRTVPVSGRMSPEQRAVYEVVESALTTATAAVSPGVSVADVHLAAILALVEGLVELGILSGTVDELIETSAYRSYYNHRTSHWLGLDVHDVGDYVMDGKSRSLEPGMVLTVEPGLYFPPGGPEEGRPFEGIGIRLEDDLLVTPSGYENLTSELPVRLSDIERGG